MLRWRGDHARVFQRGQEVGHLYRYILEGINGEWSLWAPRYLLDGNWKPEECEVQFVIEAPDGDVELIGSGWIKGEVQPDAELHREEIVMAGTSLTIK